MGLYYRPPRSAASYLMHADVRLHVPLTHRNGAGLDQAPGFSSTGLFRIHGTSPLNGKFNWGDSDSEGLDEFLPNFFGLASQQPAALVSQSRSRSHSKTYSYFGQQIFGRSHPLRCEEAGCAQSLISSDYVQGATAKDLTELATCASFRLQDSGWNNQTALGYFRSDWRGSAWNSTASTTLKKPVWLAFKGGNGQSTFEHTLNRTVPPVFR